MALTKKQRQQVWDKSGGRCWYCGCELPEKGWHADHVEPVIRKLEVVPKEKRKNPGVFELRSTNECIRSENDVLSNIVPACAPCNLFKSTYDIEFFRQEIEAQIERVRKKSSGFKIAERMGIIESKPDKPVVFWFEQQGLKI